MKHGGTPWLRPATGDGRIIGSWPWSPRSCSRRWSASCYFWQRALYAKGLAHSGLIWNLFLAWLPMLCSLAAYNLQRRAARGIWILVTPCILVWLLFFPNAPYILTDIIHLRHTIGCRYGTT